VYVQLAMAIVLLFARSRRIAALKEGQKRGDLPRVLARAISLTAGKQPAPPGRPATTPSGGNGGS
jgi:hypothetical protein